MSPWFVFIVSVVVPVVSTFAGGVPTSVRFGLPLASALKSQLPSLPSAAPELAAVLPADGSAAALLSSLLNTPVVSRITPATTRAATSAATMPQFRLRRWASSARRSSWRCR